MRFSGGGAGDRDRLGLSHVPRRPRIITTWGIKIVDGYPTSIPRFPHASETLIYQPPRQSLTTPHPRVFFLFLCFLDHFEGFLSCRIIKVTARRQGGESRSEQYHRIYSFSWCCHSALGTPLSMPNTIVLPRSHAMSRLARAGAHVVDTTRYALKKPQQSPLDNFPARHTLANHQRVMVDSPFRIH